MGPRTKQDKQVDRNSNQHESPIYLKNVSNFKASLRRRDSQRFLKREIKVLYQISAFCSARKDNSVLVIFEKFPSDRISVNHNYFQPSYRCTFQKVGKPNSFSNEVICFSKFLSSLKTVSPILTHLQER